MAKINKSELIKLQKGLRRDRAIGKKFGITRQAVHQLRKKYGILSVVVNNPARNKQMKKMYDSGKSVVAIAKKYQLSVSYTYRIIGERKKKTSKRVLKRRAGKK